MRLFKSIVTLTIPLLIIYTACRKFDAPSKNNSNEVLLSKFFSTNRTINTTEEALVKFVQKQNSNESFVPNVIKQIGFPRWDKMFKRPHSKDGKASIDSFDYYYIPFVRDTQGFVNASMIIRASASDTSISYKCDWQYASFTNSSSSFGDSAEHYAIFFMQLDRHVFGYTEFFVTDSNLFRNGPHKATSIRILELGNKTGKGNSLAPVQYCSDIQILYPYTNCPWKDTYPISSRPEECMYTCDGCAAYCLFTGSVVIQSCWTEWVESGSSGGTGGTGGTGGGSGGNNPPECEGIIAYKNSVEIGGNCTPGWSADPTSADPGYDYCAYLNSVIAASNFQGNLASLRWFAGISEKEVGYHYNNLLSGTYSDQFYSSEKYSTVGTKLAVDINPPPCDGVMHSHGFLGDALPIFSAQDLLKLADYWKNGKIKDHKTFTFTVVTNSTSYIIMISNPLKFTNFISNALRDMNPAFMSAFKVSFEKRALDNTSGSFEVTFLQTLQQYDMGLKVFQGEPDMQNFTPMRLNRAGTDVILGTCGQD